MTQAILIDSDAVRDLVTQIADRVTLALGGSVWMTVNEAAEYLRLSPDTVYTYVAEGRIPHHRAGRKILLEKGELDTWVRDDV